MNYNKNKKNLKYKLKYFILHLIIIKFLHQIAPNFLNAYYQILYLTSPQTIDKLSPMLWATWFRGPG